jgi:hypothetical protein
MTAANCDQVRGLILLPAFKIAFSVEIGRPLADDSRL